jgi:PleD family two-component response regulator
LEIRPGAATTDAAPEAVSETISSPSARPAADWICVASARNILVVDDNDRHLDILSTILTSVGHDVETCGSGAEALRRLEM